MSGCFHVNVTSSHVVCVFSPTVVYAYTIYANYLGNVVLARLQVPGAVGVNSPRQEELLCNMCVQSVAVLAPPKKNWGCSAPKPLWSSRLSIPISSPN